MNRLCAFLYIFQAAQADRVEMEAKKKALQKDIESFTHQVIMENAAMAAANEQAPRLC
jgi:hypothetical protein